MPLTIDERFARPRYHFVIPETAALSSESHFWSPCQLVAGHEHELEFSVAEIFSLYADYQRDARETSHALLLQLQAEHYFSDAQLFVHFGAVTETTETHGFDYPAECTWANILANGHVFTSNLLLNLCAELLRREGKTALAERVRDIANSVYIDSELEVFDGRAGEESFMITGLRLLGDDEASHARSIAVNPLEGSFDFDPMVGESSWSHDDPLAFPFRAYEVPSVDLWPDDEHEPTETTCIVIGKGHIFAGDIWRNVM